MASGLVWTVYPLKIIIKTPKNIINPTVLKYFKVPIKDKVNKTVHKIIAV